MRIQVASRVIDAAFVDKPKGARAVDKRHIVNPVTEDKRPSHSTEYLRPRSCASFSTYGQTGKMKAYDNYSSAKSGILLDMSM